MTETTTDTPLHCPGCGHAMHKVTAPDMTIDECGHCGGTWLDAGELNALATGLAGDIEYCAASHPIIAEDAPDRTCPRCAEPMRTVRLMRHSEVILEHCQACGGFYLDRGEVEAMNEALRKISREEKGQEYRGTLKDHLVRVDRHTVFHAAFDVLGIAAAPNEEQTLEITVFYREPLGVDLHIHEETLATRVAKVLRFFAPQDIASGDKAFDHAWQVQGSDEAVVKRLLTEPVRAQLLEFRELEPHLFAKPGTLEVLDDCAIYREGPYSVDTFNPYDGGLVYDPEEDKAGLVDRLITLARALHWGRYSQPD